MRIGAVAFTALLLAACAEKAETPAASATEPTAAAATIPAAPPVPADDNLNATLWMQHSVEYAGSTETAFALAKIRLNEALKDKGWTAAPAEQSGNFANLPPAIICDLDETLLDNSAYQAWNVTAGTSFSNETWSKFVAAKISKAVPGAVDFANYAASKGITVFYVSNRTVDGESATRDNMAKLAFPMGSGNVDTFLMANEQDGWGSKKGSRRAVVAKDYRILLLLGDNFGDFVDAYKGTEAERKQVFDANATHWGHDWIVLPNPTYGSFEAVPYKFDYGASPEAMRDAKRKALTSWSGE
jgi:acid phosphatase